MKQLMFIGNFGVLGVFFFFFFPSKCFTCINQFTPSSNPKR